MKRVIGIASAGLLAAACAPLAPAPQAATQGETTGMFTEQDFAKLRFLEGRWSGTGPDGKPFFDEYDFPEPGTMRSRRFTDASFATSTDASTVALSDGTITATWGDFTWTASQVTADAAAFEPLNAPSAFAWHRVGADVVEVTHKWRDEAGAAQSDTLTLERVR